MLLLVADLCIRMQEKYLITNFFHKVKPWKKNQWTKLIYPVFRVISAVMTVKMHVTAGKFQMGTTLESGVCIFVMTKQRFSNLVDLPFCVIQYLGHEACSNSIVGNVYLKIPAGKHIMDLVAVDWFKDTKRMDHVARRQGCAAQVSIRC